MSLRREHTWRRKRLSWSILETRLSPRGYRFPHHLSSTPPICSMIRIKMPSCSMYTCTNLRSTTLREPYQETWRPSRPETGGLEERAQHRTTARVFLSKAPALRGIPAITHKGIWGVGGSTSLPTKGQQGQPGSCWVRRGSTSRESKPG